MGCVDRGQPRRRAGIAVDDHLRTTARNIYAARAVSGGSSSPTTPEFQGAMAVRNMMLPGHSRARPEHPPWATFTDPYVVHFD